MSIVNPDSDKCLCGGHYELISWCLSEKEKCDPDQCEDGCLVICQYQVDRLKCSKCGEIVECEGV